MASVGLVVPVYKNFDGFAELMASVDCEVRPIIIPNWTNNIGVSRGWNEGLRRSWNAECDRTLIMNDDVVLAPGTIEKLVDSTSERLLVSAFGGQEEATDFRPHPDFACFMVRTKEFVYQCGLFDENFTPAYFEDNDMAYRMQLQGLDPVCRMDARMTHKGSVTQNWGGAQVVTGDMFERNRLYYTRKWGGTPGEETFTTPFNNPSKTVKDWYV